MQHFSGIDTDMAAFGRAVRGQAAKAKAAARQLPLRERVADAMCEIAAIRGSCDREDLTLRFPGEELSDDLIASARRLAGRRSVARVA